MRKISNLTILIFGLFCSFSATAVVWNPTAELTSARGFHSATLLPSGNVLVVGGQGGLASAEIYDATTGSWAATSPPEQPRSRHTATLLPTGQVLVVGGQFNSRRLKSAELYDPVTGHWSPAGELGAARQDHTATLLPSGKVLVAGGWDSNSLASAEIYDPANNSWSSTASLAQARRFHTATLLQSGEVFLVGGAANSQDTLGEPEFYSPGPNPSWRLGPAMTNPRFRHSATLLPSGEVLVVGGENSSGLLSEVELFRPDQATVPWLNHSPLPVATSRHAAALTPDGQVIIAGGRVVAGASGQSYLLGSFGWSDPISLNEGRADHTATILGNGQILLVAGIGTTLTPLRSAEMFSPFDLNTGARWEAANSMSQARSRHTATILASGASVVVIGGQNEDGALASVERYDSETGLWQTMAPMIHPRYGHTATRLNDGKILVAGGFDPAGFFLELTAVEVFDPDSGSMGSWESVGDLSNGRNGARATLLDSGRVLIAGGFDEWTTFGNPIKTSELYFPRLESWQSGPDLNHARSLHSLTRLASGQILVAGGSTNEARSSAEVYDPLSNSWPLTGNLAIGRSRHSGVLLPSGQVLVTGGFNGNDVLADEAYDPESLAWSTTGLALSTRNRHTATLLPSGQVLIVGGRNHLGDTLRSAEYFEPSLSKWQAAASLNSWRQDHTATLLRDGTVLVVGGVDKNDPQSDRYLSEAEIFSIDQVGGSRKPVIDSDQTDSILRFDRTFRVVGEFRGDSESSSGTTGQSAANFPLLKLRTLDGKKHQALYPVSVGNFWDQPATLKVNQLPESLAPGAYFLTATVAGVTSDPVRVDFECSISVQTPVQQAPVRVGEKATFSVESTGALSLQWQKNGDDITGATGSTHITETVEPEDSGSRYRVVARNTCAETPQPSPEVRLEVIDEEPPTVDLLSPTGGESWPLSPPGSDESRLISWAFDDDIRVCRVEVSLLFSNNGVDFSPVGSNGLPLVVGTGIGDLPCLQEVATTTFDYPLPAVPPSGRPDSVYKIQVMVADSSGNTAITESERPFFFVEPSTNIKTLLVSHLDRMSDPEVMDASPGQVDALDQLLDELAAHSQVQGARLDLGEVSDVNQLFQDWDMAPGDWNLANRVLFGCHPPLPADCPEEKNGIHDVIKERLAVYPNVESIVLVGDDRIIPMARLKDLTVLFPEVNYVTGQNPDLTQDSTVGQAIADNRYLSDDPLAVLDSVRPEDLNNNLFLPDLAIGRLVENPAEITTTIATFITNNGVLNLRDRQHKMQVVGYDFLHDSARRIALDWRGALSAYPDQALDDDLIGDFWSADDLETKLCGPGGDSYGLISLNGHATHDLEGVPGVNTFDIQGLSIDRLTDPNLCNGSPLDLSGSLVFSVGCHGGLPVDPNEPVRPLDLPQTYLRLGAVGYIANSGYGWGLVHGLGYSELLVKTFSSELSRGGTRTLGSAVLDAKRRYFLNNRGIRTYDVSNEIRAVDPYDQKTLMQWTVFGLPMYEIDTGLTLEEPAGPGLIDPLSGPAELEGRATEVLPFGLGQLERRLSEPSQTNESDSPPVSVLELSFQFNNNDAYTKFNTEGHSLSVSVSGCPNPPADSGIAPGCYYELNGLGQANLGGQGVTDRAIEPYFIFNSSLSGNSQHGVLWLGGKYDQESDWVPVFGRLISNGGPETYDLGTTPRLRFHRPTAHSLDIGPDTSDCRVRDSELSSLVVTTGEALELDSGAWVHRNYREVDLEAFYLNNLQGSDENCDRTPPKISPPPGMSSYHTVRQTRIDWKVKAEDPQNPAGVWRVVVVYNDDSLDAEGSGRWRPLELIQDGDFWTGTLDLASEAKITYMVQAVDNRGNVSWVDFAATQLPSSGVLRDLPAPIDVPVVIGQSNLELAAGAAPMPVDISSPLVYTTIVTNPGPDAASKIELTASLPGNLTLLGIVNNGWVCAEGEDPVRCQWDFLEVDETTPPLLLLTQTSALPGLVQSLFTVGALQDESNSEIEVTTEVIRLADLQVHLEDGSDTVIPGDDIEYQVNLLNRGPNSVDCVEVAYDFSSAVMESAVVVSTGVFTPETSEWCGLDLKTGESAGALLIGTLDPEATGELSTSASISVLAPTLDPDLSDNTATDVNEILDITAPTVERVGSVADTNLDGPLSNGLVTAPVTQLLVDFSEPVFNGSAISSYRLLAPGVDGEYQTTACQGSPAGDDTLVSLGTPLEQGQTVILSPDNDYSLRPGPHRLIVCDSIEDPAGNPLGEFQLDFTIAAGHLLRNPTFNFDLEAWTPGANGDVVYSPSDAASAASSGSALLVSSASQTVVIQQCVSLENISGLAFGGRAQIVSGSDQQPTFAARLTIFGSADCSSNELSEAFSEAFSGHSQGIWQAFTESRTSVPVDGRSALLTFEAAPSSLAGAEIRIDDAVLYPADPFLFKDGFESGDLSAWGMSP